MGYDVWGDGEFTMKAEQLKKAIPVIVKAVGEHDGDETILKASKRISETLTQGFDDENGVTTQKMSAVLKLLPKLIDSVLDENYKCDIDDLGNLTLRVNMESYDSFRNSGNEMWFFEAIAPFCDADSCIEFHGEDGYRWRWEITNGKFVEVDSNVVFGNDIKAPEIVEKLIKLIYYTEDPRRHQPGQPITAFFDFNDPNYEKVVGEIEGILRASGFGPQAGQTELERLAGV